MPAMEYTLMGSIKKLINENLKRPMCLLSGLLRLSNLFLSWLPSLSLPITNLIRKTQEIYLIF